MMKKQFYIYIGLLLVVACSSGGGDSSPEPEPTVVPPTAATLVFPNKNAECNEGTNITATQSDVTFDWNDASNATSYQLVLKNLDTQTSSTHSSTVSDITLTIMRGTPYSWYVISKNDSAITARSETWNFYNAGEAVTSYAPFPAQLVTPTMGISLSASTPNVLLQWIGADLDNDIAYYDIVMDTSDAPSTVIASNLSDMSFTSDVSSGNSYFWKVITYDEQGNSSTSEVFEFKVN